MKRQFAIVTACFIAATAAPALAVQAAPQAAPAMPTALKPSVFGTDTPAARSAATPLKAVPLSGIDFGGFVSGAQPGTVTVSPRGERTAAGGVILIKSKPGRAGLLMVTGLLDAPYALMVTSSPSMHPLLASEFGTLGSGSVVVPIGGVLTVPANTRPGFAAPVVSITAHYR